MPKNKTHSGASKRFKVTGSGKIRRLQAGRKSGAAFASAPTTGSRKKHRRNAGMVELEAGDVKRVKKMLGICASPTTVPWWLSRRPPAPRSSTMARVKRAVNAQKKRRTTLERASGYRGQRSRLYRKAKEQVTHSLVYSYNDRRKNKGNFRKLWIQRINAAARANGMTYNRFIQGLGLAGIEVDRKILAELAVKDAPAFAALVEAAKAALPEDVNAPKVSA